MKGVLRARTDKFSDVQMPQRQCLKRQCLKARQRRALEFLETPNWFSATDFITLEKITGYKQDNFNSEDGYQDFVDVCERYWKALPKEDKLEKYKEYGRL
jgi:hypothetical protein